MTQLVQSSGMIAEEAHGHLERASHYMAEFSRDVREQESQIEQLRLRGHALDQALKVLSQLRQVSRLAARHRDQIIRHLAIHKVQEPLYPFMWR